MPAQSGEDRVSTALQFSLIPVKFRKKMGEIFSPSSSTSAGNSVTELKFLPNNSEVLMATIKYTDSDECYNPIGLYTKLKGKYTVLSANSSHEAASSSSTSASSSSATNDFNNTGVSSMRKTILTPTPEMKSQPNIPSASPQKINPISSNTTASLPLPKKVLYPPNLICLGWKGSVPVGAGFVNLGNTCYLNSALQALLHVPAFVNWLLSDTKHISQCESMNGLTHSECLICAMVKILYNTHKFTGSAIKPLHIYSKLKDICKHLVHGHQEDAHEFLRYLIEGMERSYLTIFNGMRLDSYSKETTPLNQIFGGYMRTEVTCLECGYVSTTFQHFQDLLLDIRQANSVEEALESYFSRERLGDGDQAYKCGQCKKRAAATKKFSIERPPKALCIQLKRFNAMGGKNNKHISVKQTLDMTRFIHPSHPPGCCLKYKLVSMVSHLGQSSNCGHYTAIGQSAAGSYYHFDDSIVRPVALQNVLNTNAYIIMYELVETARDNSVEKALVETNGIKVESNDCQSPQSKSQFPEKKIRVEDEKQITPVAAKQPHSNLDSRPATVVSCGSTPSSSSKKSNRNSKNTKENKTVNSTSVSNSSECSLVPYLTESSESSDSGSDTVPCAANLNKSKNNRKLFDKEKNTNSSSSSVDEKNVASGSGESSSGRKVSSGGNKDQSEETCTSAGKWSIVRSQERDSNKDIAVDGDKRIDKGDIPSDPVGANDTETTTKKPTTNGTSSGSSSPRNTTMQSLMELSHQGYGTANVNSWNGNKSKLSKDIENRVQTNNKRPYENYNEDCERGKVKKKRYKNNHFDSDGSNSWNRVQDFLNRKQNWNSPLNGSSRQNYYRQYTYEKSKGHNSNNHSHYRGGNYYRNNGAGNNFSMNMMSSPLLYKKPHCT